MFKLRCKVQNYDWGKLGADSTVAQLVQAGMHAESTDDKSPYAELWMGVHPNGHSLRSSDGKPLYETFSEGELLAEHEQGTLQFLFKILSVQKALSVQSHPTKSQAVELHARDPKHYPDSNHKPEMAIALTEFQLLCGFRPAEQIYANLKATPELLDLLGAESSSVDDLLSEIEDNRKAALKKIFTRIWSSSQEDISKAIEALIRRLKYYPAPSDLDRLLIRLDNEYPGGDVGVFAPLLLNYFTLHPGQSTFLGPNRPHAYLFGDCVECMACSDNTIRAGLTPKFKDIHTLCSNLDYTMSDPPLFNDKSNGEGIRLYSPPVPEFAVQEIKAAAQTIHSVGSSSLLIVISGSASLERKANSVQVSRGNVVFISNDQSPIVITDQSTDFLAFQAYTPVP